jgi:DNA-binding NarL/FixJ family response regulator
MNRSRIVMIEDDEQTQVLFTELLQANGYPQIEHFSAVADFLDALDLKNPPNLILLDIMLGLQNALVQLPKIRLLIPDAKIIVVTGYTDEAFLFQALKAGADSFYIKGEAIHRLLEAIQQSLSGHAYLSPQSANQLITRFRHLENTPNGTLDLHSRVALRFGLKKREIEVLNGLLAAKRYKEIAEDMHVSINTVRHYVVSLYQKTGIRKREDLLQVIQE